MNSDHYLDALNHGFMQFSRQAGKTAAMLDLLKDRMDEITGLSATGMWIDEWADIESGEAARRHDKAQSELEAVPGFATF